MKAAKQLAFADKELMDLGAELEEAWCVHGRLLKQAERQPSPDHDREFEHAANRCSKIVRKIQRAKATSLAGLRVKARAVAYCHEGRPRRDLGYNSTDIRIAGSIVADLLALRS